MRVRVGCCSATGRLAHKIKLTACDPVKVTPVALKAVPDRLMFSIGRTRLFRPEPFGPE